MLFLASHMQEMSYSIGEESSIDLSSPVFLNSSSVSLIMNNNLLKCTLNNYLINHLNVIYLIIYKKKKIR